MTCRSRFIFSAWALSALVCLYAASFAQAQKVTQNIPYTTGVDGPELADLYQPAGAGPFPAIVYIHGGSWRSGNKNVYKKLAGDLAQKGYVGFAINYDLHPHSFPISFEESQAAVRFVRKHAAEYHVNPDKIVVAGDSAGGQLAALVALAPQGPAAPAKDYNAPPDDTSAAVAAAVIFNGVYSLSTSASVIQRYLGITCESDPGICADASPATHLHAGAPPMFIGHGTADTTVPYSAAESFVAALRAHQLAVTPYTAEGAPHSYWAKKDFYAANLAAVEAFLANVLHSQNAGH